MSDPRKYFMCKRCHHIINDSQRKWGNQSICPFCGYDPNKTDEEQLQADKINGTYGTFWKYRYPFEG